MKVTAFATPSASWFDIQELVMLGVIPNAEFADRKTKATPSIRHTWVSDMHVVYAESLSALAVHSQSVPECSLTETVYFVGVGSTTAKEYALPVLEKLPTKPIETILLFSSKPNYRIRIRPASNCYKDVYRKHAETKSYVHALQPLMYKIKDKDKRKLIESQVHAFLGGVAKKPPATGIERIDTLLANELTSEFRSVCIRAAGARVAVEDACGDSGFNPFEVIFVLKRCSLQYRTFL
jgi:hypothetical protein